MTDQSDPDQTASPGGSPPPAPPARHHPPPPGGHTPPAAGYGDPVPGYGDLAEYPSEPFRVDAALEWAWRKFRQHTVASLVSPPGYLLAAIPPLAAAGFAARAFTGTGPDSVGPVGVVVIFAVLLAVTTLGVVAYLTGGLDIADGAPITVASFFRPRNPGMAIATALVVFVITQLAAAFLILPGLVFQFLAQYAVWFAIDLGASPRDALTASFRLVLNNFGDVLLIDLVCTALLLPALLLLWLGLIATSPAMMLLMFAAGAVALPVALLVQAYTYRQLSGGGVSPVRR